MKKEIIIERLKAVKAEIAVELNKGTTLGSPEIEHLFQRKDELVDALILAEERGE